MDIPKVGPVGSEVENGVKGLGKGAMNFQQEFMEFLKKYQVIGLAVAFVIGTAATQLVNAIVKDAVMPIVAVLTPSGNWQQAILPVGPIQFAVGDLLNNVIDFIIIALAVFMIVKYVMRGDVSKKV